MSESLAPSRVFVDTGDMFRIRNDWTPEFPGRTRTGSTLVLDPAPEPTGKTWRIEPGKTALVPFRVIQVWWGDPRSRDRWERFHDSGGSGMIQPRTDVIKLLGVRYGSYAADVESLLATDWPRGHPEYGQETKVVPHPVSIQTEDGQLIIPACFDREGDKVFGFINTSTEDLNDQVAYQRHLEDRLAQMEEQQNELKLLLDRVQQTDATVDTGVKKTART